MIALIVASFSFSAMKAQASFGKFTVARFSGGADAAVSLQFDDSMTTQLANALPLLNARNIRATFFVNTSSWQYQQHQHEWEVNVPKAGHELGNHTAHHSGAKNVDELTKEIGDCSDHLAKVFGPKPRLVSFATPGGVSWNFTSAQLDPIFQKYNLILAAGRNFFDEQKVDPVSFVQHAIDTHSATNVAMHGTGGEWLSTSIPNLTRLLDFIAAHRPAVWVAPTIEIYKYIKERDALILPEGYVKSNGAYGFAFRLDPTKLNPPNPALFDQPLTIHVTVPEDWRALTYKQGTQVKRIEIKTPGLATFETVPGAGPMSLQPEYK